MPNPKEETRAADSVEIITMEPRAPQDAEDGAGRYYLTAIVVMFIVYQLAPRPILYDHLMSAVKEIMLLLP